MINLDGALIGNLIQYINSPVFIAEKQSGGVINKCNMLMRNVTRKDRVTLEDILSTTSLQKVLNAESGESVSVAINKEFVFNASIINIIYANKDIVIGLIRSTTRHQSFTEDAVDLALKRGEIPILQKSITEHIAMSAVEEIEPKDRDSVEIIDIIERIPEVSVAKDALLKSIHPAIRLLNSSDSSIEELVQDLFSELASIANAHKGFFWRVKDSGSGLVMRQEYSWVDLDYQDEERYGKVNLLDNLEIKLNISLANAMMVGRTEMFTVSKMSEKIGAQFTEQGIKSLLLVPLMYKRNMVAALVLADCVDESDWSSLQKDIANILGSFLLSHVELAVALSGYDYYRDRLDNSADAADMLVWEADADMTFTYLSDNCELLTGYNGSELLGKDIKFLLSKLPKDELLEKSDNNKIFKNIEKRLIKKDTTVKWVSSFGSCIYNDKDEIIRVQGITLDITESKNMAQNLRNAKFALENVNKQLVLTAKSASFLADEANKASKAKSFFLANMSHEIRTPMNAILGMINVVKQTELTDNQLDYLKKIDYAANVLLGVISDILDFSKIEAGKLEIELAEFNIENTLNNILGVMATQTYKKGIELLLYTSLDIPDIIIGDSLRLNQVLTNLLNNAVKFTDEGEITVTAEVQEKGDNRTHIKFAVNDTGVGISKEYLSNIFVEFSQESSSTTRQYGGTGLGLPLCKRIVELMGGQIWVESIIGVGSTFYFTVPYSKPSQDFNYNILDPSAYSELSVLVVDDNIASLNNLNRILNQLMISKVQLVANAEDAVQSVKEKLYNADDQFDLILMDWGMPEKNGYMLLREISQIAKNTMPAVILLVTEYERSTLNMKKVEGLAKSILLKPVTRTSLYDSIAESFSPDEVKIVRPAKIDNSSMVEGIKILLAEDNELNQLVAKEILERHGAILTIVNNGQEAVNILSNIESDFDIILMDLQMPVLDGIGATRMIRNNERFKNIPIIAMTAHDQDSSMDSGAGTGLDGFVSKPIKPDELFGEIARLGIEKAVQVHSHIFDEILVDDNSIADTLFGEPVFDEPVLDEPVFDEPVFGEPVLDEPVFDEPVLGEPVLDEPALDEPVFDGHIDMEIELGNEFIPPKLEQDSNILLETNNMDIYSHYNDDNNAYGDKIEAILPHDDKVDLLPEQRFIVSEDEDIEEGLRFGNVNLDDTRIAETRDSADNLNIADDLNIADELTIQDEIDALDVFSKPEKRYEPEERYRLDKLESAESDIISMLDKLISPKQDDVYQELTSLNLPTLGGGVDVSVLRQNEQTRKARSEQTLAEGVEPESEKPESEKSVSVDYESMEHVEESFIPTEPVDDKMVDESDFNATLDFNDEELSATVQESALDKAEVDTHDTYKLIGVQETSKSSVDPSISSKLYDDSLLSGIGVDMSVESDDLSFMDTLNESIKDSEKRWFDSIETAEPRDEVNDELLDQLDSLTSASDVATDVDSIDMNSNLETIISDELLERWATESEGDIPTGQEVTQDNGNIWSLDSESTGIDDFGAIVNDKSEDVAELDDTIESKDIKQLLVEQQQVPAFEIDRDKLDEELADIVKQLDKKRGGLAPNYNANVTSSNIKSIGRSKDGFKTQESTFEKPKLITPVVKNINELGSLPGLSSQTNRIKPNAGGLLGEVYLGDINTNALLKGDVSSNMGDGTQLEQAKSSSINAPLHRGGVADDDTFPIILEGFDVQSGIERISGNASLYKIILHKLRDDLPFMMEKLEYAVEQNDRDDILSYLHNLKGILGNVSAVNSYQLVKELEEAYTQGESEEIGILLVQFVEAMEIVERSLNSI